MDFFDKLKQGIDKGVKTVSVKSKEMVDATKAKSQLSSLRDLKRTALEELGGIAYSMFRASETPEPRIKEKCERIDALDRQIAEKEQELLRIHRAAEEALAEPPPAPAPTASGAPAAIGTCQCGAELKEGAKFCAACGKPVDLR